MREMFQVVSSNDEFDTNQSLVISLDFVSHSGTGMEGKGHPENLLTLTDLAL